MKSKPPYIDLARVRSRAEDVAIELGLILHFCREAESLQGKDWPAQVHEQMSQLFDAADRMDDATAEIFRLTEEAVVAVQKPARLAREAALRKKTLRLRSEKGGAR